MANMSVVTSVVREGADKGFELVLSLPVSRTEFYLGRLLGHATAGAAIATAFALPDGVSNWSGTWSVTTPVFEQANARLEFKYGGTALFAEAGDGRETRVTATLGLRPADSLRIEGSLVRSRIVRDRDGSEFARSTIPRIKAEFQPRRSFFVRVIAEYRSDARAALVDPASGRTLVVRGATSVAQQVRGLRMDWLASFKPTPGTVAFFGYGSSFDRNAALYGHDSLERTSDGFFVKLAYLVRR